MNSLGLINLFLFMLIAPAAFATVRSLRGIMVIITVGWLTLSPRAGLMISGLPELTKDFAVSYAVALGILLFRSDLVRRIKLGPIDVFAAIWIFAPAVSSLTNGLGPWDACSESYGQLFRWGVPYLLGRTYVRSLADVRDCATGVLLAGLIAAPLCLLEIRMSPQIHRWVYGIHQAPFHMTMRLGGYRPMLMFRHGIEVGAWMACATVVACWFAMTDRREKLASLAYPVHAAGLLLVTLLCRSLGALGLLFGTLACVLLARSTRAKIFLAAVILATPAYITVRVSGLWSPEGVADFVERNIDAERAESLRGRISQEIELGAKAAERPFFGWGGQNRFRVFDDYGEATTAVDALWLIAYGKNGIFGLIGLYGMLCIPALLILRTTPMRLLVHRNMAGVLALILAIAIATGDSLQNAFYSPLMMIAAGALATTASSLRSWLPRPTRSVPQPPNHPPQRVSQ